VSGVASLSDWSFKLGPARQPARVTIPAKTLTLAEIAILRRVVDGQSNKTIALALDMKVDNVKSHIQNARRRFGAATTPELLDMPELHAAIAEDAS
jgi:DNA-binding CsgD family transcriptional regulator